LRLTEIKIEKLTNDIENVVTKFKDLKDYVQALEDVFETRHKNMDIYVGKTMKQIENVALKNDQRFDSFVKSVEGLNKILLAFGNRAQKIEADVLEMGQRWSKQMFYKINEAINERISIKKQYAAQWEVFKERVREEFIMKKSRELEKKLEEKNNEIDKKLEDFNERILKVSEWLQSVERLKEGTEERLQMNEKLI